MAVRRVSYLTLYYCHKYRTKSAQHPKTKRNINTICVFIFSRSFSIDNIRTAGDQLQQQTQRGAVWVRCDVIPAAPPLGRSRYQRVPGVLCSHRPGTANIPDLCLRIGIREDSTTPQPCQQSGDISKPTVSSTL